MYVNISVDKCLSPCKHKWSHDYTKYTVLQCPHLHLLIFPWWHIAGRSIWTLRKASQDEFPSRHLPLEWFLVKFLNFSMLLVSPSNKWRNISRNTIENTFSFTEFSFWIIYSMFAYIIIFLIYPVYVTISTWSTFKRDVIRPSGSIALLDCHSRSQSSHPGLLTPAATNFSAQGKSPF